MSDFYSVYLRSIIKKYIASIRYWVGDSIGTVGNLVVLYNAVLKYPLGPFSAGTLFPHIRMVLDFKSGKLHIYAALNRFVFDPDIRTAEPESISEETNSVIAGIIRNSDRGTDLQQSANTLSDIEDAWDELHPDYNLYTSPPNSAGPLDYRVHPLIEELFHINRDLLDPIVESDIRRHRINEAQWEFIPPSDRYVEVDLSKYLDIRFDVRTSVHIHQ